MPGVKVNMRLPLYVALLLLAISCSTYKGLETRLRVGTPGEESTQPTTDLMKVKRVKAFGITVSDKQEQVYDDEQLERINQQTVAAAETEAKAKTAMFKIEKRQNREDIKTDTAKFLSWACFALALVAVMIGVITEGYKKWGIMAGSLFVCGMVSLLIPELIDYLKWVIIALGAGAIIMGLSHTKHFSIKPKHKQLIPGSQESTEKDV